jgi:hypothetical protein
MVGEKSNHLPIYGMANKAKDLRRCRFGRLVAIERTYRDKESFWKCLCDCGKIVEVRRKHLLSGNTVSCGCHSREQTSKRSWKGYEEISGKYWYDLARNAKYRLIDFEITIQEAWLQFLKQERRCSFTGQQLTFAKGKKDRKEQTASLDRYDNEKGYTVENCCWIHKSVNRLKNDFSVNEFLYWCKAISDYHEQKNPAP